MPLDEQASNTSSCVINAQLRSFNLHRLRTIEAQRDEAATTFDSEHHQLPDSNSVETKPIMTSADNREAAEKLEPNRILRVREQLEMVPFSPNKVVLSLDPMLQNQDTSFFTGNTSSRRQRRRNLFYEADTEEEVDCTLSIIELKTNLQFSSPSNSRSRRRRSRYLKTPGQEKNRNTTQTSELSVRGLGLKRRRQVLAHLWQLVFD